jgi:MaoC like domain
MMNVCFSASEVKKWADLSGDYNPIHFDADEARLVGIDVPVVHGMLALLPVKQILSDRLLGGEPDDNWFRFKAMFRNPIPQDGQQSIVVVPKLPNMVKFRMEGADQGKEHYYGTAALVPRPAANNAEQYQDARTAPLAFTADGPAAFARAFPYIKTLWIWLDALVFAQFITVHLSDLIAESKMQLHEISNNDHVPADTLLVQTSQETFVPTAFATNSLDGAVASTFCELSYEVIKGPTIVTATEVCGVVQVSVRAAGKVLLVTEYGLLLKKVPTTTTVDESEV